MNRVVVRHLRRGTITLKFKRCCLDLVHFCVSEHFVDFCRWTGIFFLNYPEVTSIIMASLATLALTLHLIIEVPASINFLLKPTATLPPSQTHGHGLIRQYGLLLLSINIIIGVLLSRSVDLLTQQVAGALALYHVGPVIRAVSRIQHQDLGGALGGPWLHAFLHVICAVSLAISSMTTIS